MNPYHILMTGAGLYAIPADDDDEGDFGVDECTCRRTGLGPGDPDDGWKLDKWCPVHGLDPDEEYEKMREREGDRDDG